MTGSGPYTQGLQIIRSWLSVWTSGKGLPRIHASILLLQHPLKEAANRCKQMSDHDKNLFIEQHKDGYAILRGGVKEPLAVEPTQDAAIEKARKLESDAAIHVERVRNVEGGGRDKWRRI